MRVRTNQPPPWAADLNGQERLQQEITELNLVKGNGQVTLGDLPEGQAVLIVPTPEPPGYLLYFKTGPDYPLEPPSLMAEKNGRQLTLSSRTITNWRPNNRLAEVVVELTHQANQRRFLVMGGSFGLAAIFLIGLALLMFLGGETRLEQSSADGTAQAIATQLDRSNNRLNTAIAQATATVQANPKLGNAPNPTLTAAFNDLVNIRNQNESALATVTAVARQNLTATADAVIKANAQTQATFLQNLTATADAQQKLTAAAAQQLTAAAQQQLTAAARQQLTAAARQRATAAALTAQAVPPPPKPTATSQPAPPNPTIQPTAANPAPQPTAAPAPPPAPAPTLTPPPPPTTTAAVPVTVEVITPQPTPTTAATTGNEGKPKGPGGPPTPTKKDGGGGK